MNNHRITRVALAAAMILTAAEMSWAGGMKQHSSPQAFDWTTPRDLDTDNLGVDFSRETDIMFGYGVDPDSMKSRRTGTSTMDEPAELDSDQEGIEAEEEIDW